jgi:glycosyltransferase involved in cell wall biosynthesis
MSRLKAGASPENVVISAYRMRDHGFHSGYVQLARLLGERGTKVYLDGKWQWTIGLPLRFGIPFTGMPLYNAYRLAGELRIAIHMRFAAPTLYHFLYGEASYRYTGPLATSRGHRLLATFHLPADKLRERIRSSRHLAYLSGIVCVSHSQFAFFEDAAPNIPRYHVPLGVDCAFFTPGESRPAVGPRLLCVGEHLRDWRTLVAVHRRIKAAFHNATLTLVTPPDGVPSSLRDGDTRVFYRLSDLDLRDAYRSADVLVLPLQDGTASNTALEAMACGLPIVATRIPSMVEYIGEDAGLLCARGDSEAMAESVLSLLQNSSLHRDLGARARLRAESFNWNLICERMQSVYREVMN